MACSLPVPPRSSHRGWTAVTRKFKSRSAGMLVEFRSTGCQAVLPPGTHESGEAIEWEVEDAVPAVVDPAVSLAAVEALATAVKFELGEQPVPRRPRNLTAPTAAASEPDSATAAA